VLRTIANAILLGCLLAFWAASQNEPAFRSNVEIVVLPCTVVDADGVAVRNLTRDEFRVFDNDTRRPIENFWIDDDLPLTLGLIIDASQSQKEQLSEHLQTAIALLERILRPGDRAFVVSVDEDVRLWADLAETMPDLRRQLAGTPGGLFGEPCAKQRSSLPGVGAISACGSSPLWDAIYDAARLRLRALTGNKALLILTDGFDSGSAHSWHQAADAVSRADASLYAVQYPSAFGGNFAPDLYRLVADAGGTTFSPPDDKSAGGGYSPIVSRIEMDLRHRYVLGFRPERLSGKVRHEIRVEVTRPDLLVRARKTYFQE
jgi:Ca-activated chloride channel family protein